MRWRASRCSDRLRRRRHRRTRLARDRRQRASPGFFARRTQAGAKIVTNAGIDAIARHDDRWRLRQPRRICRADRRQRGRRLGRHDRRFGRRRADRPRAEAPHRLPCRRAGTACRSPAGRWSTMSARNSTSSRTPARFSCRRRMRRRASRWTPIRTSSTSPSASTGCSAPRRSRCAGSNINGPACAVSSSDGSPVVGFDDVAEGFFWLAGQGGYGIKTSPALARACRELIRTGRLPDDLLRQGIEPGDLAPGRIRRLSTKPTG